MNLDRLLDNRTPMRARCFLVEASDGFEVVTAVAKLTWHIDSEGHATLFAKQHAVRGSDQRYELGGSVRAPGDYAPLKPGTDVLLRGTVMPDAAGEQTQRRVRLVVAASPEPLDKVAQVYGPRVWMRSGSTCVPSAPAPLQPTPLRWENSYGGRGSDEADAEVCEDNPVGHGFGRRAVALEGKLVPSIEHPDHPLDGRAPRPCGFGPVAPDWSPRSERVGTRDERWQRERAPQMPDDFDLRHFCCAPDDQWLRKPLSGDEAVMVEGLHADGAWRFKLPAYRPAFSCAVADKTYRLDSHLDTVLIDADERTVELTWRASVRAPRKIELVRWFRIAEAIALPQHALDDLFHRFPAPSEAAADS